VAGPGNGDNPGVPKAPPLFVVEGSLEAGESVTLDARARRHARARRLAEGDAVRLTDGAGGEAEGTVERLGRDACDVRVGRVRRSGGASGVELLVSAVRLPRLSWIVEKATELGAGAVTVVASERAQRERVESAARDRERLARIARGAAEQSGQTAPPSIAGPVAASAVLPRAASLASAILLDRSGEPFPESLRAPAAIWVGPEGGWTAGELAAAERSGWRRIRLPGATLRTETAAIAGLVLALRAIDTAARAGGQ